MKYFLFLVFFLVCGKSYAVMTLNQDVTQATVSQTICVVGYTKTVRPSVSYTNGVKLKLLRQQGKPATDASLYELDHIVPLTLGGHPRTLDNLQLQLWEGRDGAKVKDKLEVQLKKLVCAGKVPLATAQSCIYGNWQLCAKTHAGVK